MAYKSTGRINETRQRTEFFVRADDKPLNITELALKEDYIGATLGRDWRTKKYFIFLFYGNEGNPEIVELGYREPQEIEDLSKARAKGLVKRIEDLRKQNLTSVA